MGHGIFPNYGPNYIKGIAALISKAEAREVFYTSAKEKKSRLIKEKEEENFERKKERKK
jgi:hypothetical protein